MELINDKATDLLMYHETVNGCKVTLYQDRHSGEILMNTEEISQLLGLAPGYPLALQRLLRIINENRIIHNLKSKKNENCNSKHK